MCLAFAAVAAWQWRAAARASDYADYRRQQAEQATQKAEDAKIAAEAAQLRALNAKSEAETARGEANTQRSVAVEALQSAEQQTRIAKARELAATAVPMVNESLDRQGDLPVLLALQAVAATYPAGEVTREAEDALRRAVGGETTSLPFPGHSLDVRALAFNPDGTQLATCSYDDTVRVWNVARGEQLQRHDGGRCDHLAFGAAGIRLGLESQHQAHSCAALSGRAAAGRPGGRADSGRTGLLAQRRRASGDVERPWRRSSSWTRPRIGSCSRFPSNAWTRPVALSGDGTRLAYRGGSGATVSTTRIADVDSGREVQTIPQGQRRSTRAQLPRRSSSPSSSREPASTSATSRRARAGCWPSRTRIGGMAFSPPDGRVFAMFTNGDRVRLWDTASLEPIGEAIEGSAPIAFSPDGQRIAVAFGDSSARIWDIKSAEARRPCSPARTDSRLRAVAFADGATRLATGSDDRKLRVWEPIGGRVLSHRRPSRTCVEKIAISQAGDRLAGGVPYRASGTSGN